MDRGCRTLGLCLLIVTSFLKQVACDGTIELGLINYENDDGLGSNGNCCDGKWGFCSGSVCDPYFIICLGYDDGDDSMTNCPLGSITTGYVHNQNSFMFGTSIGDTGEETTPNPMAFAFHHWEVSHPFRMKIKVMDHDSSNDHDHIEDLFYTAHVTPTSYGAGNWSRTVIQGRTELDLDLKVYCEPDYYGPDCSIVCQHTPGYYMCSDAGQKICEPGLQGEDCSQDIDECLSSPCLNGGSCQNGDNQYSCVCPPDYSGENCEEYVDPCDLEPCVHGSCTVSGQDYVCSCYSGYTGNICDTAMDPCESSPCTGPGSDCIPEDVSFRCDCAAGWSGDLCDVTLCVSNLCENEADCVINEQTELGYDCVCKDGYSGPHCQLSDVCLSSPCVNGATCVPSNDNVTCLCASGWEGELCDVRWCPCINGGMCESQGDSPDYVCACPDGWTGSTCETEVKDPCEVNPCLNGGDCIADGLTFNCICAQDYTGATCDVKIDYCQGTLCMHGGSCTNVPGGFSCACSGHFSGPRCDTLNDTESSNHADLPVAFPFRAQLVKREVDVFMDELLHLVAEERNVSANLLLGTYETAKCTGNDGLAGLLVLVHISDENGDSVPTYTLKYILDNLTFNQKQTLFYGELYGDGECDNSAPFIRESKSGDSAMPTGTLLAIILGSLGVVVCVGLIVLGVMLYRRQSRSKSFTVSMANPLYETQPSTGSGATDPMPTPETSQKPSKPPYFRCSSEERQDVRLSVSN